MKKLSNTVSLFIILSLCSCSTIETEQQPLSDESETLVPLAMPATFTGYIPCPDCERVDVVLNLRPDQLYQLRKSYRDATGLVRVESQMGKWRYSPEGRLLILGKEKGALKTYALEDENRLRFIEWEGSGIDSQIEYDLVRSLELDPFPDMVKMRGMFRLKDNEATVTECSSKATFPVSRAAGFSKTAQHYMNTPHPYGEAVLISFNGHLQKIGDADFVEIDHFRRFYPNSDCEGNEIKANLTGTYWRLIEIGGESIDSAAGWNAPYLLFDTDKTVTGFSGCNTLNGTYLIQGDVFLFDRSATTRIACPDGMETETILLQALDESETYRIGDEMLELIDQLGKVRVRFQAGP